MKISTLALVTLCATGAACALTDVAPTQPDLVGIAKLTLSEPPAVLLAGDRTALTATAATLGGLPVVGGFVSWQSTNTAVATVELTGDRSATLVAVGPGTADISAQIAGLKTSFSVIVRAQTQLPASAGTLAFVSERDGNPEIYAMSADGTGITRLTNDGMADVAPEWSPDGKHIAFESDRDGVRRIYVMDANGSNVVLRTPNRSGGEPTWSADGAQLAFKGSDGIYVTRAEGVVTPALRVGDSAGFIAFPAWSRDGASIAFTADFRAYDTVYDLYVMDTNGSRITPLLLGPLTGDERTFYFQPAWSPDNRSIAMVACKYARKDCFPSSSVAVVNSNGTGLRTLMTVGGYAEPAWSPDGRLVAFSSSACSDCSFSLRFVAVDGSQAGIISVNARSPSWRP